jgi:hypothetical protein
MSSLDTASDRRMNRTYVLVLICHAGVITALWLFGRIFSR